MSTLQQIFLKKNDIIFAQIVQTFKIKTSQMLFEMFSMSNNLQNETLEQRRTHKLAPPTQLQKINLL